MRKEIFVFTVFFLAAAFPSTGAAEGEGHYQLVQGHYTHYDGDNNTSTENNDLFLLDTVTGEAKIYSSSTKFSKQTRYWMPAVFDENEKP